VIDRKDHSTHIPSRELAPRIGHCNAFTHVHPRAAAREQKLASFADELKKKLNALKRHCRKFASQMASPSFAIYSPVTQQTSGFLETSVDLHGLTGKVFETARRMQKRAPSRNPLR